MSASENLQKGENVKLVKFRLLVLHLLSLGVFFVPFDYSILILFFVVYFIRVFAWEGGSHRYFAHRSFETSRVFQFVLAALASSGGQRGPLWWATKHRDHHLHSDKYLDPHSPVQFGRNYAYIGWLLDDKHTSTDLNKAKDFLNFRELIVINKYHYFLPYISIGIIYVIGEYTSLLGVGMGLSAIFWGGFLPIALSLHSTFILNVATHAMKPNAFNLRRFETEDTSTNSWLLSIVTMGASWHHNHHRYMKAARAGFYWWEIDLVYYVLKLLSVFGVVWNIIEVPKEVLDEGRGHNYAAVAAQKLS